MSDSIFIMHDKEAAYYTFNIGGAHTGRYLVILLSLSVASMGSTVKRQSLGGKSEKHP